MSRFTRLRRDHGGATAIEYALIGGLIGLGLIGSLVSTKGSLSAIFGVASSQMGSATNAPAPFGTKPSSSSRASFWSSKTLAGSPVTTKSASGTSTVYTFTDGTIATFTASPTANYPYQLMIDSQAAGYRAYTFFDASKTIQAYQAWYYDAYPKTFGTINTTDSIFGNPPTPTWERTLDAQQTTGSPDATFTQQVRTGNADMQYFLSQQ